MGGIWLIFGAFAGWAAENHGGAEAEVGQGVLTRWSAWWSPSGGTEARCWWESGAAGAAWLKVGEFQFGPLREVPGAEGTVVWGPGLRQTGTWGASWSGKAAGVWFVQQTEELESGVRVSWGEGPVRLAGGAARSWSLAAPGEGPRWTDRGFAGGGWTAPYGKAGAEVRTLVPEGGPLLLGWSGRLSVGDGPWDLEGRGRSLADGTWTGRVRALWDEGGLRLEGGWDLAEGASARASAEAAVWSWTVETEGLVRCREGLWSGWASAGLGAKADRGRWKVAWTVVPEPGQTVQKVEAAWKEPGLEASADWTAEGLRLGWFGPGSRLVWKLRWFF